MKKPALQQRSKLHQNMTKVNLLKLKLVKCDVKFVSFSRIISFNQFYEHNIQKYLNSQS